MILDNKVMLITYADRGFAPMRYDKVDEAFGDFGDIARLGKWRAYGRTGGA